MVLVIVLVIRINLVVLVIVLVIVLVVLELVLGIVLGLVLVDLVSIADVVEGLGVTVYYHIGLYHHIYSWYYYNDTSTRTSTSSTLSWSISERALGLRYIIIRRTSSPAVRRLASVALQATT